MIEPKRKKKSDRKKKQGIDLTNAPVKRKAVKAARRVVASQVRRHGILAEPSRGTEF